MGITYKLKKLLFNNGKQELTKFPSFDGAHKNFSNNDSQHFFKKTLALE